MIRPKKLPLKAGVKKEETIPETNAVSLFGFFSSLIDFTNNSHFIHSKYQFNGTNKKQRMKGITSKFLN